MTWWSATGTELDEELLHQSYFEMRMRNIARSELDQTQNFIYTYTDLGR